MKSKSYDYIIKGAYGTGNFGDDALLDVLLEKLPKKSKVAVITKSTNYLERMYPNIDYYTHLDNVKLICNHLILGGGTQYFTFESNSKILNRITYHLKHPKYVIGRLLGWTLKVDAKNKVGLGLGLGPFLDTESKQFKKILENIKDNNYLFVRDNKSFDFCKEYGVTDVSLCTDLCFMREIKTGDETKSNNKSAIILRDWEHDDYGRQHFKAIKEFMINNKSDYDLVLFANDQHWISFASSNQINYHVWNPEKFSVKDFINKLNEYDSFISSRFHGMVYSTLLNKPSIAIDIEPKLSIGAELNSGLIWKSGDGIKELELLVTELKANYDLYKSIVNKKLDKEKVKSKDIDFFIKNNLIGKGYEV